MASRHSSASLNPVEDDIKDMKIKSGNSSDDETPDTTDMARRKGIKEADDEDDDEEDQITMHRSSRIKTERMSTLDDSSEAASPPASSLDGVMDDDGGEKIIGGEITVKQEPGETLKLERKGSRKVSARPIQTFDNYEDKTGEASQTFQLMQSCTYSSKNLGYTEHAMDCDCAEEWDQVTSSNLACGEDSDCINRATKMECVGDCGCGANCQNQRFQRRQYADIAIIKTEKKGYGVRANAELAPNQFIFEYIGEVINEREFRKRMVQYDDEGIKHFYFMSLSKGEFVDATKKGNLGRFCNHSCNPNCYVDKWVVGDKLRMGIFAERRIGAGEELVFNYNVDRYGADPQPCYCGEPNCTGYIGGKTQTERATKLSHATLEALGIDDGDGWDTTVARRPRKKRQGEDDEEYVDSLRARSLDEDGVTKVMAALMQCKEKWIAVKLLDRIQRCEDASVRNRVIRMHGYQILKSALSTFKEDDNVVLQIMQILDSFPRVTRNKVADSKIEDVIPQFMEHEHERIAEIANRLLKEWSKLEIAYRIPRVKRDPNAKRDKREDLERRERDERRRRSRTRSRSRSRSPPPDAPRGPAAPTGPKNAFAQRPPYPRPFRPPRPLPQGWHSATFEGRQYYYTGTGITSWTRPTMPAAAPTSGLKSDNRQKHIDNIIAEIQRDGEKKAEEAKAAASVVPISQSAGKRVDKEDKGERKPKWMSYDESKQKKIYENTIHPHIKHVVDKYKSRLPKDNLKENFKSISKKIVESDFRKKRVTDPNKIDEKKQRDIKKFTKEYFDKLLQRHKEHEKKKLAKLAARAKAKGEGQSELASELATSSKEGPSRHDKDNDSDDDAVVMDLSDEEDGTKEVVSKLTTPVTPLEHVLNGDGLKRKRAAGLNENGLHETDPETSPKKRARSTTPPPPSPLGEDMLSAEPSPVLMIPDVDWEEPSGAQQYDESNPAPPPLTSQEGFGGQDADQLVDEDNVREGMLFDSSQTVQT